jgi:Fe-S oxidoreductase
VLIVAEDGSIKFLEAVRRRIDHTLEACTKCGKCVEACPMTEPAGLRAPDPREIVTGLLDILAKGPGTPDAERFAEVCTNSGKCIPACDYGVNPRFMVNMARIAVKERLGDGAVRQSAKAFFNTMNRSTRMISRLQLSPEVHARLNPPIRPAGDYADEPPDIVFYAGCNVIKTPHIALLVLEVLDALGVTYEVMGGASTCCGIQHFKQGDAKIAGRIGFGTIERLQRPGATRVISWCPSCQIQIGEVALPAYEESFGAMPFDLSPIAAFFEERLDQLRPLFAHPVPKRVALQERSAVPGIMAAVKNVLAAIPELEVVALDVPILSTQASHLNVVPEFKAALREMEFKAAAEAGVTTFASIFHGCHRELISYQPQVPFETLNFMELIGESMGLDIPDLYKRLQLMGDIDAIINDTVDLIGAHRLDLDTLREVIANDMLDSVPRLDGIPDRADLRR